MNKIMTKILAVTIAAAFTASAATYFVRPGASGNGSSWSNALGKLPSSLQRGSTYYLASGSYGWYSFNTPASGSQYITVKKATDADFGGGSGWQSSYGSGQAVFSNISVATDYWVIDGAKSGAPYTQKDNYSWTSGHGIKIQPNWSSTVTNGKIVHLYKGVGYITFKGIEMTPAVAFQGYGHAVYGISVHDITVEQCYMHDNFGVFFLMRGWQNSKFRYNYCARNKSTSAYHSEAISESGSDNITIWCNFFVDTNGTSHIAVMEHSGPSDYWVVYGNIFYHTSPHRAHASGILRVLNDASNDGEARYWKIYHNTIYNIQGYFGGGIQIQKGTSVDVKNNLWYKNDDRLGSPSVMVMSGSHDYNFYSNQVSPPNEPHGQLVSWAPFVDPDGENFRLSQHTASGFPLPAPFDVDMYGNKRGATDNIWDRGALQYGDSGTTTPPESDPPSAPPNPRFDPPAN